MKIPLKVNNKLALVVQIILGIYLAMLYMMQSIIYEAINFRFWIRITNNYPFLTFCILYLLTAPLAVLLSKLLFKKRLSYDDALLAGLATNYSFVFTFALLLFLLGGSVFAFIGVLFFASLFGFVLAAITAVLNEKISVINLKRKF